MLFTKIEVEGLVHLAPGKPLFPLGEMFITPGAMAQFNRVFLAGCLSRHVRGDWGEVPPEDVEGNELALAEGYRILSQYRLPEQSRLAIDGGYLWIVTEGDRSATTLLLPSDY